MDRVEELFASSFFAGEILRKSLGLHFKAVCMVFKGQRRDLFFPEMLSLSVGFGCTTVLNCRSQCVVNYTLALLSDSLILRWWLSLSKIHQTVIISKEKGSNVQASNLPLKISTWFQKHKTSNDLLFWTVKGWKHFWNLVCSLTVWGSLEFYWPILDSVKKGQYITCVKGGQGVTL